MSSTAGIDPAVDRIVARYALPGGEQNHGLLIDSPDRLAFVACQGNDKLLVFDMRAQRVVQAFDIGKDQTSSRSIPRLAGSMWPEKRALSQS
ncbi:hypothetical protein AWB83_01978 [Caballeronia ptereochthonis]|uniref:YVTN beta-propeller repeat-containing protein n=1 Tax=Caballeronia ptereochthonis TaxID=1777144 RepID=A0A158AKD2_9BURK|nr:hypothetical protein AWB83_01978 [Caballeronia ptereochthonis]